MEALSAKPGGEANWRTESAHRAIRWSLDAAAAAGRLSMAGQKVVAFGGGAELSPTRALLRAGADGLFIGRRPPSDELMKDPRVSGSITWVPAGTDLLEQPREIASTIHRFAGEDSAHMGMYAYSGGAMQEWRLTATMNAIVRALPRGLVRSVIYLLSASTPGTVSPEEIHGGVYAQPYAFERCLPLCALAGFVRRPSLVAPAVRFALTGR